MCFDAESNQTSLNAAMENFNKTQEIHMQRERELTRQIESATVRIATLTVC
jgi:hypothetical protein